MFDHPFPSRTRKRDQNSPKNLTIEIDTALLFKPSVSVEKKKGRVCISPSRSALSLVVNSCMRNLGSLTMPRAGNHSRAPWGFGDVHPQRYKPPRLPLIVFKSEHHHLSILG